MLKHLETENSHCSKTLSLILILLLSSNFSQPAHSENNESFVNCETATVYSHSSGLSFNYPSQFKRISNIDKDTLLKVEGELSPGVKGEITVGLIDNSMGLSAEGLESIYHNAMFSKLEGVRKTKLEKEYVGKSGRILAYSEVIKFTTHAMPIHMEFVIIPCKNKFLTFTLVTQPGQRFQLESAWQNCLNSITAPSSLITLAPAFQVATKKKTSYCDSYSNQQTVISKPTANMNLDQKVALILPRKSEERFLEIPWQNNILSARRTALSQDKPIFVWIMDGHVLGAT